MFSRRSFLLGLGGLVTSSFVARAARHIMETDAPLLLDPGRTEETLYIYDSFSGHEFGSFKWRVSLGPDVWPAPPPPTWREYLEQRGYRLGSKADQQRLWDQRSIHIDDLDLDSHLDGYSWESEWEHNESPQAKAAILLKELKLDCALNTKGEKAGRIDFVEWGGHPGSCERWVDLRHDLTVSLLQARLLEAGHPLKVVVGEL